MTYEPAGTETVLNLVAIPLRRTEEDKLFNTPTHPVAVCDLADAEKIAELYGAEASRKSPADLCDLLEARDMGRYHGRTDIEDALQVYRDLDNQWYKLRKEILAFAETAYKHHIPVPPEARKIAGTLDRWYRRHLAVIRPCTQKEKEYSTN